MKQLVPNYYKDFKCLAGECKDNCCVGGWQIDIDEETAKYYLSIKGSFGDRLRASIQKKDEYCFKLIDNHCPFLDNCNLCEIYKNLGEDKMGVVCTQFPRFTEYYGNQKETGIGIACEEAARIVAFNNNDFNLVINSIDDEEACDSEYDEALAKVLFPLRDKLIKLSEYKIEITQLIDILNSLIIIGSRVQKLINDEEINSQVYNEINRISELSFDELLSLGKIEKNKSLKDLIDGLMSVIYAYENLEVLNNDWTDKLNLIKSTFEELEMNNKGEKKLKQFIQSYKSNEFIYRNLYKYFIYRYFMKAVYDHDVNAKCVMVVTNIIVLIMMDFCEWMNKNKLENQDIMTNIHIFSREVEYSEDNLEDLKEEFLFDDIFKATNLCSLLNLFKI